MQQQTHSNNTTHFYRFGLTLSLCFGVAHLHLLTTPTNISVGYLKSGRMYTTVELPGRKSEKVTERKKISGSSTIHIFHIAQCILFFHFDICRLIMEQRAVNNTDITSTLLA